MVGVIFNNGHGFKKVTAAYAVSCELDICSKVLGMNYFQNHFFYLFLFFKCFNTSVLETL